MSAGDRLLRPIAALIAAADAYLLLLLAAAALKRRRSPRGPGRATDLLVLVPAHDEEGTLPRLFASLDRAEGRARARVVVIADNCSDRTAAVAQAAGAEVLERHDPENRGKGQAIAWALERLASGRDLDQPVVMVDADCEVSPNLLTAFEARLGDGASALQADYVVANPDESPGTALRAGAFALVNSVRPRGRDALGLSSGLLGTGMCFTPDLLRRVPWRDFGLAEDLEYGLRLAAAGERVVFVPEARVTSPMPATADAARDQQLRWEGGKLAAARYCSPRLLADGLAHGDLRRVVAGLEPLVPPQSLLLAAHAALVTLAIVTRAPRTLRTALAGTAAQVVYVIGGLALVRAPLVVWRALLHAPLLVAEKLRVAARLATGKAPQQWVRTERDV